MSAKAIVMSFRSPKIADDDSNTPEPPTALDFALRELPHDMQNFATEGHERPQFVQVSDRALPHSAQNLAPISFRL
jgi:hypothetical protein